MHAALAGTLPQLLADPETVAHVGREALLQGLALAWPDGVPLGGVAADAHYLEEEGVEPDSQGEWLAWLHWAAVNRGQRDWAHRLLESGVSVPWHTTWSRRRPYGAFGPYPGQTGALIAVGVVREPFRTGCERRRAIAVGVVADDGAEVGGQLDVVGVRLERGVGCGIDHDHEYVRGFRRFPCDPLLRAEGTAGRIGGQGRRLQGMR